MEKKKFFLLYLNYFSFLWDFDIDHDRAFYNKQNEITTARNVSIIGEIDNRVHSAWINSANDGDKIDATGVLKNLNIPLKYNNISEDFLFNPN